MSAMDDSVTETLRYLDRKIEAIRADVRAYVLPRQREIDELDRMRTEILKLLTLNERPRPIVLQPYGARVIDGPEPSKGPYFAPEAAIIIDR